MRARWRVLAGPLIFCLALLGVPAIAGELAPLAVSEVAPGIYVHTGVHAEMSPANRGDIANIGFIVGERCVAVIDPGGSLAVGRDLRAALRRVTDKPVCYVIYTHLHPDHALGGRAFLEDHPKFVGHRGFPAALKDNQEYFRERFVKPSEGESVSTPVVAPDVLVEGVQELDLGGRKLKLETYPKAHTDTDLSIYDEQSQSWWLGDLLFVDRIPSVDGSLKGWLKRDEGLRERPAKRAIPGHGPASVAWPAALEAQDRYLTLLAGQTRAAIQAGKTLEQALEQVGASERANWRLFEEYHKRNLTRAYKELEWE
jgi:quinoprotein relay system zinc metallohydrolase 2